MTCIEFQKGLEPFFDSEANFETALEMQAHIEQCLTCEGLFSGCLAVRRCLQNPDFRYRPAADLSHQIHRATLNEIRSGSRSRSSPLEWLSRCRLPNWLLPLAAVLVLWDGTHGALTPDIADQRLGIRFGRATCVRSSL